MREIHFGTDGWRGVIADEFTTENVKRVVTGIIRHLLTKEENPKIVIGYDNRFMSEYAAGAAARTASENGVEVLISPYPISTPLLSHAVVSEKASGGIMVTASHNPFYFNGIKFKASYGGSALPGTTAEIESLIPDSSEKKSWTATKKGEVVEGDFLKAYTAHLSGLFDLKAIKMAGHGIVMDCMHGSMGSYIEGLADSTGLRPVIINSKRDPYFGGINPEPTEENLTTLAGKIEGISPDIVFAFDGDGDRLGVMDGGGVFVRPYEVMSLLTVHMARNRGLNGKVIKTFSSSSLIDRVSAGLGLEVVETPIGFKHICGHMLAGDVLIGGEENGGIGFKGHLPERDGFLAALMLLEMMAVEGKPLRQLLEELYTKYGETYHKRLDSAIDPARHSGLRGELGARALEAYREYGVRDINELDGTKLIMKDGSWVLFRLSGTEPLLRIYSEADTPAKLDTLLAIGKEAFLA